MAEYKTDSSEFVSIVEEYTNFGPVSINKTRNFAFFVNLFATTDPAAPPENNEIRLSTVRQCQD